jgi:rhamnosyltransferase
MKIAACVILYQPGETVLNNIMSYINTSEKIYITDNTEDQTVNFQFLFPYQYKIMFIHDRKNEGIAMRLNQACEAAIKDGFDYLLTMDQDSYFEEPAFSNYLNCIENFSNKESVSMFGVNYKSKTKSNSCSFRKTNLLITSGSIVNLNVYKNVGAFDENLFIDMVDTDYCLRSLQKGFDVIEFPNIYMHHQIGFNSVHRSLRNFQSAKRAIHTSTRLYYMTRNYFYLRLKYQNQFEEELNSFKKDLLHRVKNNLLYKQQRFHTISLLLKAWNDYKQNKMGKLSK